VVRMSDVSREAGVSTATVSRVLTGSAEVDPKTKKLVLAAVEKLKYRPNLVARGLRRRLSHVIALIVTDIENPFYTAICRGVEDVDRRLFGYSMQRGSRHRQGTAVHSRCRRPERGRGDHQPCLCA
jgi:LacI family transcriptional regulator